MEWATMACVVWNGRCRRNVACSVQRHRPLSLLARRPEIHHLSALLTESLQNERWQDSDHSEEEFGLRITRIAYAHKLDGYFVNHSDLEAVRNW